MSRPVTVERTGCDRFWQVLDEEGELVCKTVYRRGGQEIVDRAARVAAAINELRREIFRRSGLQDNIDPWLKMGEWCDRLYKIEEML